MVVEVKFGFVPVTFVPKEKPGLLVINVVFPAAE